MTKTDVLFFFCFLDYGAVTVLTGAWGARATSLCAWRYGHQGGRLDVTTELYHFRMREYSPSLGRWPGRGKLGVDA
jgi:RHS repeat-associated protein